MAPGFVIALVAVVVAFVVVRLAVPGVPPARWARSAGPFDVALIAVGGIGLVFHCGAMFFPRIVGAVPVLVPARDVVNAMDAGSMVLYIVPAVLVVVGLRRQNLLALGGVALALVAVGVTMYDGSPLRLHLTTIFVAATAIASVLALLVRPGRGVSGSRDA